ncbi:C40 family peptidase [Pseudomonas denitrificans (nom. rej.)]|nr:C40 family peptidase [Pseudomonas denitrificans (nom. rej.)]
MRPLRWIPFCLLCTLAAPFALADELDAPDWRRFEASAIDRSFLPAASSTARPAGARRNAESVQVSHLDERSSTLAQLRHEGRQRFSPVDTSRIVARAYELIGTPYRWGGQTEEDGFDCSGLLVYLYRSIADRRLPRTTASMIAQRHNQVDRDELQPGDAVFFNHNGAGATSHVGLYIGGDRFIHAPRTGKTIRIDSLDNSYWQRSYTTARRFSG